MPIHEKSLIRPENLEVHEHLEIEGVDVSGHWSTFIETRVVCDYNEALQEEIDKRGIQLANIEPGKPWQNGSNESFNGTFRKECLNAEIFASLTEARVVIENWRRRYNERRPHSSQNYITPEMAYFGLREMRRA